VFIVFICEEMTCLMLLFVDVLSNRKLLSMLLKNKGFESTTCEDGMQAFNIVTRTDMDNFDVIFMDNTMPVMVRYVL
jgi:CheY-like chemotaxis protein